MQALVGNRRNRQFDYTINKLEGDRGFDPEPKKALFRNEIICRYLSIHRNIVI
jgi:hypothetical protein